MLKNANVYAEICGIYANFCAYGIIFAHAILKMPLYEKKYVICGLYLHITGIPMQCGLNAICKLRHSLFLGTCYSRITFLSTRSFFDNAIFIDVAPNHTLKQHVDNLCSALQRISPSA